MTAAPKPDILGPVSIAAAVLMTLLTALNFFALDRYVSAGDPVAVLPSGGLSVVNDDPAAVVRHDLPADLGSGAAFIGLTAVAEGFDIAPGERRWQRGRIVLLRQLADGQVDWEQPHVLALLEGNPARFTFGNVFRRGEDTANLAVRIELLRATGRLEVYSVTATPLKEAPGFRSAAGALMIGWAALALAVSVWAWRRVRDRRWLIGFAWLVAAVALGLSVLPGSVTAPAASLTAENVDLVASGTATETERAAAEYANGFSVAKTGHVLVFVFVGAAFGLARGASPMIAVWLLAAMFAGLCETLQIFSPDRTPALFDLSINLFSASAGCWLAMLALAAARRRLFPNTRAEARIR
ncbi:MAG: VanZ family protein [Minwuia sp.]|uniref:VanZ family protein n=1 Tax=Minwuia sp. TaxID=2493630 RepID=UPI003A8639A1